MPEATRQSTPGLREETPALPPIADLVSREIRRMGRSWKIEATKSVLHIVLTMLVVSVLGAGWFVLLMAVMCVGWYAWWRFKLRVTVKPYGFLTRSSVVLDEPAAASEGLWGRRVRCRSVRIRGRRVGSGWC